MFIAGIIAALSLSTPAVKAVPTSPEICSLLQAAYSGFDRDGREIHPSNVKAATNEISDIKKFVVKYKEAMELTNSEFADLAMMQGLTPHGPFVPSCQWKGRVGSEALGVQGVGWVAFSQPIISSDGQIALVEVSSGGNFSAYGLLCIMRVKSNAWSSRCLNSWSVR